MLQYNMTAERVRKVPKRLRMERRMRTLDRLHHDTDPRSHIATVAKGRNIHVGSRTQVGMTTIVSAKIHALQSLNDRSTNKSSAYDQKTATELFISNYQTILLFPETKLCAT